MPSKVSENSVIIYSSARRNGNTNRLAMEFGDNNNVAAVYLDDYKIHAYRYDKDYEPDDFYSLFENLLSYEHWILASPVYWYSTTSQMKLFIDRITDYMDEESLKPKLRGLRDKRFSLLSNSVSEAAPEAFTEMFKHTFSYLGMEFVGHEHVCMS